MAPPNLVDFPKIVGIDYFKSNVRTKYTMCTQYILSAWKVVQMTQPEFVDSQVYFDALVLKYLS